MGSLFAYQLRIYLFIMKRIVDRHALTVSVAQRNGLSSYLTLSNAVWIRPRIRIIGRNVRLEGPVPIVPRSLDQNTFSQDLYY